MTEFTDEELAKFRARDAMQALVGMTGWELLARWVKELADEEARAIEGGVEDWPEYQKRVARLNAFRDVLGRPEEVIEAANRLERGEMNG